MQQHNIPRGVQQNLLVPNSAVPVEQIFSGLSGGLVYRCESEPGPACLRAWPKGKPSESTRLAIRTAIDMAHRQGIAFVPKFFRARDGQSYYLDGTQFWDLSEWLPGSADYLASPSDMKLESAMQSLARLHIAWSEEYQIKLSPATHDRLSLLANWLARSVSLRKCDWVADPIERALCRDTLDALHQKGPTLQSKLQSIADQPVKLHLVLRDIWSEHVLFRGQSVSGIIDFGGMRVDEPATDVARLLGSLEGHSPTRWNQGLAYYRALHPEVDPWRVTVLDQVSCLLSALQWMQWLVIERRPFQTPASQLLKRWDSLLMRSKGLDSFVIRRVF